jgi:DNA polymerase-1
MKHAQQSDRLVLVDGSGYIFRAYHALPPMYRADSTPVNAVFGFTKMLIKLVTDLQPQSIAVIFDAGRKTFRNEIYSEYKANRGEPPEELIPQFDLVRQATEALNLPMFEMVGYEADDVIATFAKQAFIKGQDCLIVSSDKDLMQLVNKHVKLLDPMKNTVIGDEEVQLKFGVFPDRVVDVQALAGDSSDNVPGVPGIGIKTAAELINQFGDLEALLAQAETIKQPKRRENLVQFADQARLSQQLVLLRDDVPVDMQISELILPVLDRKKLHSFLVEQGFKSLAVSLGYAEQTRERPFIDPASTHNENAQKDEPKSSGEPVNSEPQMPYVDEVSYQLITDLQQLDSWCEMARDQGKIAIDTETTSLNAASADLVGVALAIAPGKACYIPLRHSHKTEISEQAGLDFGDSGDSVNSGASGDFRDSSDSQDKHYQQVDFNEAMKRLKPLLEDPAILKIGHNLKYDAHILQQERNGNIRLSPLDDTMCLSYVLDAGRVERHGLDFLAMHWLSHQTIKYQDVCGKGAKQISFAQVTPENAKDYAAEDADITLRLWTMLKPRLANEGMTIVYERLERALIHVLSSMEQNGIVVDASILRRLSNDFAGKIALLETEIHSLAGQEFNIASPKQLGEILFEKLGFEGGKKSKTGAWSTGADILDEMAAAGSIIAQKVLDYRQLAKLKSTYTDALLESVNSRTGRVHTSYSMVGALTGRLSSSDPNLQNIPIRTEEGRSIRTAFIAEPGSKIISADYSQIELRLVAHIAKEKTMLEAFQNNIDIHAQTAAEVFQIPIAQLDSETRRRAKAINFGIIYGISGFGLARQLGISQTEARDYIKAYFARFPGIRDYMEQMKQVARDNGFVETLFGRRIYISNIKSSNGAVRGFAERQAINAPIQGSAADIIKRAMIKMPDTISALNLNTKMLLQVHDELIFETAESEIDIALEAIKTTMETAHQPVLSLDVPIIVDGGAADSWAEAH